MLRLVDGLLAGALIGGVWWYTRRDQKKADAEAARAERLAELAERRAQRAEDRARVSAAGATDPAGKDGKPPPASASTALASTAPPIATSTAPSSPHVAQPGKPAGLSRRFDDLFARHGRGIPVAFLRALSAAESGMNPNDRLGLINVVPVALADYNRRNPSAPIKAEEMRDPVKNITVAADHLRTIIDGFRKHHPDVPNLVEDWRNLRFVQLLVFSWNAGHSELSGVGRVVGFLKAQPTALAVVRPSDITIDSVFDAAWSARAASHLSNRRKLDYSKGVAAAYFRELARDQRNLIGWRTC